MKDENYWKESCWMVSHFLLRPFRHRMAFELRLSALCADQRECNFGDIVRLEAKKKETKGNQHWKSTGRWPGEWSETGKMERKSILVAAPSNVVHVAIDGLENDQWNLQRQNAGREGHTMLAKKNIQTKWSTKNWEMQEKSPSFCYCGTPTQNVE